MHQLPRQGRGSCTCKPHTLGQPPLWQRWSCSCRTGLARRPGCGRRKSAARQPEANTARETTQRTQRVALVGATGCDDTHSLVLSYLQLNYLSTVRGFPPAPSHPAPCPPCAARPALQPTSLVSRSTTRARADRRGRVGLLLGQTAHCTCVRAGLRHDVNARCAGLRAVWLAAHDPRRGRIEELGRGE